MNFPYPFTNRHDGVIVQVSVNFIGTVHAANCVSPWTLISSSSSSTSIIFLSAGELRLTFAQKSKDFGLSVTIAEST